jgi:AraC family transcriptional regulator of adaptative response/methylated-DNA-[protein]-cysteine methyltransferase
MTWADPSQPYDYKLIKSALEVINAHNGKQFSLDEIAREIGMSAAHFQLTFSQWAGVSPKRLQQFLTLSHTENILHNYFTHLDITAEAGGFGTGRLHDLFVKWEVMSPGEFARKGKNLVINFGWFATPFGKGLAMGTDRGLCGLAFSDECGADTAWRDMSGRWPHAHFAENPAALEQWVTAALNQGGNTSLHLMGAPFQIKVWEALLTIPSGHVTTYSEIAEAVGKPKAVRAVGTAVGRNPISWLIPCHRVLLKSGGLGGYHWGLQVKRAMLAYETARLAPNP